jgi:probable F420-dependent oxidoreductase
MTHQRRFRFALLAKGARDADAWRQQAVEAQSLGYDALLAPDHLGQEWAPVVSLTSAASVTTTISLGTLMLAVDMRSPVVLFKELATVAQLAPGRLEIGIGAGWLANDFKRAGVDMAAPATRIERVAEAVIILKSLWQGSAVTFAGQHFSVSDALPQPTPLGPVKWVLGGGGRKMLAVAAEHADIVSLGAQLSNSGKGSAFGKSATIDKFRERVRWVRDDTGPRFDTIELQVLAQVCAITPDRDRYASRVLTRMFDLAPEDALASPLALVGTVTEVCDRLQVLRDELGVSYWVVPAAQMRPFAEVVGRLRTQ